MSYVIGVDLGTSAVKVLLVDRAGNVCAEVTKSYPLLQEKPGYSEQDPEQWYVQTIAGLRELLQQPDVDAQAVEGLSISGQMHGLVMLDEQHTLLRPAILWNDTRTTAQCEEIRETLGGRLVAITKNPALEGFTLPKLLWVKQHEPDNFARMRTFLLPKDYVRFRLTGELASEFSDAAGTLMLDMQANNWSEDICRSFGIDPKVCPPLVDSAAFTGTLLSRVASETGLSTATKVFAGGADNACGATGAGILSPGLTMCSIGTSGVILSYEDQVDRDFQGKVHFFNHALPGTYYTMGVTLAAGYSLQWWKERLAPDESFDDLLAGVGELEPGSGGLLFTPYLVGERTPHADSVIRGSLIGLDASHTRKHIIRAVMEGITFSLQESISIFRDGGKTIDHIVSIGGGAKNAAWLHMQADIFNARVTTLHSEQGPGMGAAMLAACGCGWFETMESCARVFTKTGETIEPDRNKVDRYRQLFDIYKQVYHQTVPLNKQLAAFRRQ